jgi:hypothetical protein
MSSIGEWVDEVIPTVLPDVRAALTSALQKTQSCTSDLAENRGDLLDKDHELLNGILDGGPGLVSLAKKKLSGPSRRCPHQQQHQDQEEEEALE